MRKKYDDFDWEMVKFVASRNMSEVVDCLFIGEGFHFNVEEVVAGQGCKC